MKSETMERQKDGQKRTNRRMDECMSKKSKNFHQKTVRENKI
jgi:hypothetical protein